MNLKNILATGFAALTIASTNGCSTNTPQPTSPAPHSILYCETTKAPDMQIGDTIVHLFGNDKNSESLELVDTQFFTADSQTKATATFKRIDENTNNQIGEIMRITEGDHLDVHTKNGDYSILLNKVVPGALGNNLANVSLLEPCGGY